VGYLLLSIAQSVGHHHTSETFQTVSLGTWVNKARRRAEAVRDPDPLKNLGYRALL
jgi:hypothetical protein